MSFKRLDPEDFIVSADSIVGPAWSTNSASLSDMYTSNTQRAGASGNYYLSVYQENPASSTTAEVQFNIAYGDRDGSGSANYYPSVNGLSPTRTVYGQFRNLIYGDENAVFSFGGTTQPNFYALTIERARYKQSLFPGGLNLVLDNGTTLPLTDNSKDVTVTSYLDCGRVYELVSGSDGSGVSNTLLGAGGSFGFFLPDIGTIILNPAALDDFLGFTTNRTSDEFDDNQFELFDQCIAPGNAGDFGLLSQETVTSDFVFVRARNGEFNYSENPSFISDSNGAIIYDTFIQNPQTYITSVGMYNDNNELLAVAKLSKPLKKDFTKEALIRVKLDF